MTSATVDLSPDIPKPNTAPSSYTSRETEPANNVNNVTRAKINISLKKKPKSSSSNQKRTSTESTSTLLANEYTTIAEEAEIISRRRKEEGTVLIIPCNQSKNELDGHHTMQPLLAGRLASLRMQQSNDGTMHGAAMGGVGNAEQTTSVGAEDSCTGLNKDVDAHDDETVITQLIQSAEQSNADKEHSDSRKTASTTSASARGGLVILAPSQNKLNISRKHNDDEDMKDEDDEKMDRDGMMMNDDELFKRELSHHAADVEPTSNVYANVAIHDFGPALLRGMGWTGGPETSKKDETNAIKPRPHRLGLGATPLLPIPTTTSGGRTSNGTEGLIHRRARRPDEVKRDEDRRRQQEEAEKREDEKKRLDVQYTLQKGSVVHVINQDGDTASSQLRRSNCSSGKNRALVIRTAGVPGLNRILIQREGSSVETSVTKHSVSLCSWEELKLNPYKRNQIQSKPDTQKVDRHSQNLFDDKRGGSTDDILAHGDARSSIQCCYKEGKRRKRDDRDHRSRSRSGSREKTSKRKKETSDRRGHRDGEHYHRSRRQSSVEEENSSSHHRKHPKDSRSTSRNLQQLHWLVPNIRVRVISEKLPKYYLKKGIVQDVLRLPSRDHGDCSSKATLLMDCGQVLDKVPERYLETALPKTGGNVIILEGTDDVRWKIGRLLERSSKDGQGAVQLEEDLDVVRVSLDCIAEWCG